MRLLKNRQNFVTLTILGLLLALALPAAALANQQGKRRNGADNKHDRKCAKFVNCHDASDGRVDGKGPRPNRTRRVRNRINDRRDGSTLRNRSNRRFGVRELNRTNTARIRRTQG